jgi:hypothetical protein
MAEIGTITFPYLSLIYILHLEKYRGAKKINTLKTVAVLYIDKTKILKDDTMISSYENTVHSLSQSRLNMHINYKSNTMHSLFQSVLNMHINYKSTFSKPLYKFSLFCSMTEAVLLS